MGFQGSDERFAAMWQIKAKHLRRLVAVNGDMVVTIYRDDTAEPATAT